jgi:hypothetical protein
MVDKKELKRRYKETRRPMGVFRILNKENGKSLVSSSVNLPAVFNKIRMQLKTATYLQNSRLQRDWNELGADAFELEVLEELEPPPDSPSWDPGEDLQALEELWLEKLEPYDERGYNRRPKTLS